jgi:uncharacterized protein YjiS (DUF1127 family)
MNFSDFARIGRAILLELRARAHARSLNRFDDRMLADMGVPRGEIDSLVRSKSRRRG